MQYNNLTKGFQNHKNNQMQFVNNQMLANNPMFMNNIHDPSFYQKMMLAQQEQINRIKNVSELGLNVQQITDYVICPIKVARTSRDELVKAYDELNTEYTQKHVNDWWAGRTNNPYKNILKNEDHTKKFNSAADLIVHKVTDLDKIGLLSEYKKLMKILEKHNNELKMIYSASNENESKKKFEYVNKFRDRMKYDPKDFNDLKDYYKKEQKKLERDQNNIDNIIDMLMENENIDQNEIKRLESCFNQTYTKKSGKKSGKKSNKNNQYNSDDDELLMELLEEHGEEILNELEGQKSSKNKKPNKKISKKSDNSSSDDSSFKNKSKNKKQLKNSSADSSDNKNKKSRIVISKDKKITKAEKTDKVEKDNSDISKITIKKDKKIIINKPITVTSQSVQNKNITKSSEIYQQENKEKIQKEVLLTKEKEGGSYEQMFREGNSQQEKKRIIINKK